MIDNYIKVSKFGSPHGLKGYIRLIPIIDPPELLNELNHLYLEKNNKYIQLEIEVIKPYKKNSWLFKAKRWDSIDDVQDLVNNYLSCKKGDLPELDKNRYYIVDVIGCDVFDLNDKHLGKVLDVLQYSSSDIYKIGEDENNFLLPAVKEFIKSIDINNKLVKVNLPEGIEDI